MCIDRLFQILIAVGKKEYLYASMLVDNCMCFRGWPHVSLEIGLKYDAGGVTSTTS